MITNFVKRCQRFWCPVVTSAVLLLLSTSNSWSNSDCDDVISWQADLLELQTELEQDEVFLHEEWERLSAVEFDPLILDALADELISAVPVGPNEIRVTNRSRLNADQIIEKLKQINEEFFEEVLEIHGCAGGGQ